MKSTSSFKIKKENSYVGNIQLSKGMLYAKMKRDQEEAKNNKLVSKIFSNQVRTSLRVSISNPWKNTENRKKKGMTSQ